MDDGNAKDFLKSDEPVILHPAQADLNVSHHFPANVESQTLETRRKSLLRPFVLVTPIGHLTACDILPAHIVIFLKLPLFFFDRERNDDRLSQSLWLRREPSGAGKED
ncbi:MAG TPA: hypothetical protein VH595_09120 [Verrucomicrobiae bacterium]|nr:hypothetical protein [Verrucomicrobiae bacterium]